MLETQERIGLALYLYYNRDSRKFLKYGDIVYHSRRMRYLLLYVDKDRAPEIVSELKKNKAIKKIKYSHLTEVDQNFVGNLLK